MLLNSVMSLQRVTLFYWGQNRLLNVLPLLASVVADPVRNLWFVIFVPVTALYLLMQVMVAWAVRSLRADASIGVQAFIVLSSSVLLLLRPVAVAEIAIGHIEYSLSALLVALALWLAWSVTRLGRLRSLLIGVLLLLALGVNPAAVLPLGFAVAARVLYRRAVGFLDVVLLGFAGLAFVFWMLLSRLEASTSYAGFSWCLLPEGLSTVIPTLLRLVDAPYALLLTLLLLPAIRSARARPEPGVERVVLITATAFGVFWLLLFCANRWVALNDYNWRYFIYLVFALCLLLAFRAVAALRALPRRASWVATALVALLGLIKVWQPPQAVTSFSLLQKVQHLAPQPQRLYSGDYWLVWPAVWRDLMLGSPAFGLAYRGDANREAARAHITREIEATGGFSVLCLNETANQCVRQVDGFFGPLSCVQMPTEQTLAVLLRLVPVTDNPGADCAVAAN
ncbi:hypothetical protein ISX93_02755 [Pseudomonas sp. N040]|nr:hypothetical protein [Pseudomonas sp. N040]MBW7012632.1 hypothetical protein [Pseudomonas sp. N040]